MSSSTTTEALPIRRVVVNSEKDLPSHLGETPGGSLFSTTPGGTRIYYDRAFLLSRRGSPMARSPPNLPYIPEITLIPDPAAGATTVNGSGVPANTAASSSVSSTSVTSSVSSTTNNPTESEQPAATKPAKKGDDQFPMEI